MSVSHLWDKPKLAGQLARNVRRATIARMARARAEATRAEKQLAAETSVAIRRRKAGR